jgi:hypothetical protein
MPSNSKHFIPWGFLIMVKNIIVIAKLRPECGAASTWLSQQYY